MSSKSARGFTERLEALEKNIMPMDDSNKAALDELLDGLANHNSEQIAAAICKPKKDKAADPELEKLLEAYVKYKESQKTDKRDQKVVEELIL